MYYLLFYEKAPGYAERQKPFAEAHLSYLEGLVTSGHLLLAGNLENPADGSAVLLFQADSEAAVEGFARHDPYVLNAIISKWTVRSWDTVLGSVLS